MSRSLKRFAYFPFVNLSSNYICVLHIFLPQLKSAVSKITSLFYSALWFAFSAPGNVLHPPSTWLGSGVLEDLPTSFSFSLSTTASHTPLEPPRPKLKAVLDSSVTFAFSFFLHPYKTSFCSTSHWFKAILKTFHDNNINNIKGKLHLSCSMSRLMCYERKESNFFQRRASMALKPFGRAIYSVLRSKSYYGIGNLLESKKGSKLVR